MAPSDLLALIPQAYAFYAALFIIACKIVTVFVRPPAPDSRWAPAFALVTTIGLNVGWATNRLQIGATGIMVPRAQVPAARAAIAATVVPAAPVSIVPGPAIPGPVISSSVISSSVIQGPIVPAPAA